MNNRRVFDDIQIALDFHLEYNSKAISYFCKYKYININTKQDVLFPLFVYNNFHIENGVNSVSIGSENNKKYLCFIINNINKFPNHIYKYIENNIFIKTITNNIIEFIKIYINNNILLYKEIKQNNTIIKKCNFIENVIDFNRILGLEFIEKNHIYYNKTKSYVQSLYDIFILNKNNFEKKWININDLQLSKFIIDNTETIKRFDPFLSGLDEYKLGKDILRDGMTTPLIVNIENNKYSVVEGSHRYTSLKTNMINCDVECIICNESQIQNDTKYNSKDYIKYMYLPKNIFPYNTYPYNKNENGFIIKDENEYVYKIEVTNDVQLMQAYKVFPMILKHMINFIQIRYGENIKYGNHIKILEE